MNVTVRQLGAVFAALLMVTSVAAVGGLALPTEPDSTEGPAGPMAPTDEVTDAGQLADEPASSGASTDPTSAATLPADAQTAADAAAASDVTTLTLITGETVTVRERKDGERVIDADAPVQRFDSPDGTYVFPRDVDLSVYDPALFNIDLLIEQNLTDAETEQLPIIVEAQEVREYGNDGPRGPPSTLDVRGYDQRRTLDSIGALAGDVSKGQAGETMATLFESYEIERVHLDRRYEVTLDTSVEAIAGERARAEYGVNGSGATVAVLDTGVDATHPDLEHAVVEQVDFTGDGTGDVVGHGTHVAGTIAGDGSASNGTYVGVAPGADIIDVKVLDDQGAGRTSWIIDGMEHASSNGADVISMSLGAPEAGDDPFIDAVNAQTDQGVIVVAAAGNAGPDYRTVGSPGSVESALTVGAYDHHANEVAEFSSRGPTLRHLVKPDLLAPGVGITAAQSGGASLDDPYVSLSGTSMATPHASGVVALMLEDDPDLTPTRAKNVLLTNGDPLAGYDVYTQGSGHLNATRAVQPDLVVTNATHSLGAITENRTVNRTITIENPSNESVTLDLATELVALETGSDRSDQLAVNVSSLTLEPGESAAVAVQVNATVPAGTYSGTLVLDSADRPHAYTVAVGFARGTELTVEKVPLSDDGTVEGDLVLALSADRGLTFSSVANGNASFIIGDGDYTLWSPGYDNPTATPILTSAPVTVDGETTETLDEGATVTYAMNDSELEHDLHTLTTHATAETTLSTDSVTSRYWLTDYFDQVDTVRFSEDASLNVSVHRVAVPKSQHDGGDHLDAADVYVTSQVTTGVDGADTLVVDPATLATEDRTYYRSFADESLAVAFAPSDAVLDGPAAFGPLYPLGDRSHQQLHVTEWSRYLSDVPTDTGFYLVDRFGHDANVTTGAAVNRGPLTGQFAVMKANATAVEAAGAFMADQGWPHPYTDFANANAYQVVVDGTVVEEGSTMSPVYATTVDQAIEPGDTVSVMTLGRNPDGALWTEVTSVATVTYNETGDNTPPHVRHVDLPADEVNRIDDDTVTFDVWLQSSDNVSGLEVLTASSDVDAPPFTADGVDPEDEWDAAADVSLAEADGDLYRYEVTLDLTSYTDRPHLAIRARDDGDDRSGTVVRHAFAVNSTTQTRNITGQLVQANGEPATNHTVAVNRRDTGEFLYGFDRTDADGQFEIEVEEGGVYDLTYLQWDAFGPTDVAFPRDTNIDIYPVASVDLTGSDTQTTAASEYELSDNVDEEAVPEPLVAAADAEGTADIQTNETTDPALGTIDLPAGHVLDVEIVDWNAEPVEDATVELQVTGPEGFVGVGPSVPTDADGLVAGFDRDVTGFEVTGEVDVAVFPPRDAQFVPEPTRSNVTVTEDTVHTVPLDQRDVVRVPEDFDTIQQAVNEAPEDSLIVVANGTYQEHVTIDRSVALISEAALDSDATTGAPTDAAVLDGGGSLDAAFEIKNGAEFVFIEGFVLQNYAEVGVGAIEGNTSLVSIRENTIRNVGGGVLADDSATDGTVQPHRNWWLQRNVVEDPAAVGMELVDVTGLVVLENAVHGDGAVSGVSTTAVTGPTAESRSFASTASTASTGTVYGVFVVATKPTQDVHIVDNTIDGTYNGTGIVATAFGGSIENAEVVGNQLNGDYQANGIFIGADDGGEVQGARVEANDVTGATDFPGIGVEPFDADSSIRHVDIAHNVISDSVLAIGVASSDTGGFVDDVHIIDNQVADVSGGVQVVAGEDLGWIGVSGNEIDASLAGIFATSIDESSTVTVEHQANHIANPDYGVVTAGDGVALHGDTLLVENTTNGVSAMANSTQTLTGSQIVDNQVGVNASSGGFVDVTDSEIAGNADYGALVADGDAFIHAPDNWWGHESGPFHPEKNSDGQGDNVSDHVDFEPWVGAIDGTTVSVEPEQDTVGPGQEFTVDVRIATNESVVGADFVLDFDPTLLEATAFDVGGFLTQDGSNVLDVQDLDNENGTVDVGLARDQNDDPGVTGEGVLGTITFQVTEAIDGDASTTLAFETVSAQNAAGDSVSVTAQDAELTVTNDTPPSVEATLETEPNNVGAPVGVLVDASDQEGNVTDVTLDTAGEIVGVEQLNDTAWRFTVEFNESTWTGGEDGHYEATSIAAIAVDEAGQESTDTVTTEVRIAGDVTGSGTVELSDLVALAQSWRSTEGEAAYDPAADLTNSGEIDLSDLVQLAQHWRDEAWAAAAGVQETLDVDGFEALDGPDGLASQAAGLLSEGAP